ncbi:MAG: hypothetical protein IJR17_00480 [Clostridia bacterium]|nr:hypothetical protein [Clostridia bacterium]
MALQKCPKCELNYLRPGETLCHVCQQSTKRQPKTRPEEQELIMCSNCGEAPAVKGSDLCEECLQERKREAELELMADKLREDEADMPLEENIDPEEDEEE